MLNRQHTELLYAHSCKKDCSFVSISISNSCLSTRSISWPNVTATQTATLKTSPVQTCTISISNSCFSTRSISWPNVTATQTATPNAKKTLIGRPILAHRQEQVQLAGQLREREEQWQHLLPKVYVYSIIYLYIYIYMCVLSLKAQCAYPRWGRSKSRRSSWLNWRAAWHARRTKIFQTLAQPMTGRPASIVYAASSCSSLAGRVPDHLRAFARACASTHPAHPSKPARWKLLRQGLTI